MCLLRAPGVFIPWKNPRSLVHCKVRASPARRCSFQASVYPGSCDKVLERSRTRRDKTAQRVEQLTSMFYFKLPPSMCKFQAATAELQPIRDCATTPLC